MDVRSLIGKIKKVRVHPEDQKTIDELITLLNNLTQRPATRGSNPPEEK